MRISFKSQPNRMHGALAAVLLATDHRDAASEATHDPVSHRRPQQHRPRGISTRCGGGGVVGVVSAESKAAASECTSPRQPCCSPPTTPRRPRPKPQTPSHRRSTAAARRADDGRVEAAEEAASGACQFVPVGMAWELFPVARRSCGCAAGKRQPSRRDAIGSADSVAMRDARAGRQRRASWCVHCHSSCPSP